MGGVVLHASSPILAALFALAERGGVRRPRADLRLCRGLRGRRARRAVGAQPSRRRLASHRHARHRSRPAPPAAKLLGLDAQQMTHALGIAGDAGGRHAAAPRHHVQVVPCRQGGVERAAGGAAGAAGLRQLRGDRSRASAASRASTRKVATPEVVLDQLGTRWEITRNGHKPYACGVVLHPILDAMVALGEQRALKPDEIAKVEARVHRDGGAHHRARRSRAPGCNRNSASITPPPSPISTAPPASRSSPTRARRRRTWSRCAARSR